MIVLLSTLFVIAMIGFVLAVEQGAEKSTGVLNKIAIGITNLFDSFLGLFTNSEKVAQLSPGDYELEDIIPECYAGNTISCAEFYEDSELLGTMVCLVDPEQPELAQWDHNACHYPVYGCMDEEAGTFNPDATVHEEESCDDYYYCEDDETMGGIDGTYDAYVYKSRVETLFEEKLAYCSESKDGYYTYSCHSATIDKKIITWNSPSFNECEENYLCEEGVEQVGRGKNKVSCIGPNISIKSVELKVSDKFKKEYKLSNDYEIEGLNALTNTEGKCIDCGEEKSKITGIITEYDDLMVVVEISSSKPIYSDQGYKIKIDIDGSMNLNKQIDFSECTSKTESDYTCTIYLPKSEDLLSRGTKISATAELLNEEGSVYSKDSDYFVVAQYNLFTFSNNGWENSQGAQFYAFNQISELNKEIIHSGKPVYISGASLSSKFGTEENYAFLSTRIAGFDKEKDPFIFYAVNVTPFIGRSPAAVKGYGGTNIFSRAIISFLVKNPKAKIVFMRSIQSSLSALAHELGHWYGSFGDEYSWEIYTMQGKVAVSPNPNSQIGAINFPICCQLYVCCFSNGIYKWTPDYKCNSPNSFIYPREIYPGYYCKQSEHPIKNNYPLQGICYYGENEALDKIYDYLKKMGIREENFDEMVSKNFKYYQTVSLSYCKGMPYKDKEATLPTDLDPSRAEYWSVMGSEGLFYLDKLIYPEQAVCPLKHCDD